MPSQPSLPPHLRQLPLRWFGSLINVWLIDDGEGWTLVDCGPPGAAAKIDHWVRGEIGGAPGRILITHGHFDHTGALNDLAAQWSVPVLAHPAEHPYISGQELYRAILPADWRHRLLSPGLPRGTYRGPLTTIQEGDRLGDYEVIDVPGHSPGQVALWHAGERICIAADAFRFKPLDNMPVVTYDRDLARQSMQRIMDLKPLLLLTSHGSVREF